MGLNNEIAMKDHIARFDLESLAMYLRDRANGIQAARDPKDLEQDLRQLEIAIVTGRVILKKWRSRPVKQLPARTARRRRLAAKRT